MPIASALQAGFGAQADLACRWLFKCAYQVETAICEAGFSQVFIQDSGQGRAASPLGGMPVG